MARFKERRAISGVKTKVEEISKFQFKSELNMMRYVASGYPHPPAAVSQILDNACDAGASKVRIAAFKTSNRIVIMYDGAPISKIDMEAIRTGVGKSSKTSDYTKLGRFGTGFITFLSYADKQTIISKGDGLEYVWENSPDEVKEELTSIHRPLQMSEKDKETKFPMIKYFLANYKAGNYILIENIHSGKFDTFYGTRFTNAIGNQWIDRLLDPSYTLGSIEYAKIGTINRKVKWTAIKATKKNGKEFKKRIVGIHIDDKGMTQELAVDFDLLISTKIDGAIRILNRNQPIMSVVATDTSNGLQTLSKQSILRDKNINGAIRIKADSLLSFDRARLDEYASIGKAFINACDQADEYVRAVVKSVLNDELDNQAKADNEKYTAILNDFCQHIGFNNKSNDALVKPNSSSNKSDKDHRDFRSAMESIRRQQDTDESKDKSGVIAFDATEPRKKKRGYGTPVKIEPFLKEQRHIRYKTVGDTIRVNREHSDFKLVCKLPNKSGARHNYIIQCALSALALKTKTPEISIEEEILRLLTMFWHMRSAKE